MKIALAVRRSTSRLPFANQLSSVSSRNRGVPPPQLPPTSPPQHQHGLDKLATSPRKSPCITYLQLPRYSLSFCFYPYLWRTKWPFDQPTCRGSSNASLPNTCFAKKQTSAMFSARGACLSGHQPTAFMSMLRTGDPDSLMRR